MKRALRPARVWFSVCKRGRACSQRNGAACHRSPRPPSPRGPAARADAEEARLVGHANAERARAENQALTPLAVMKRGYEALEALGGTDAHIMLGDWSKVPSFLFPFAAPGVNAAGRPAPPAKP